jgi:protein-S-isoprenylcysteine O-methyltransferase Ste14
MSRLPALGPRGEGWVAIQVVIFAAIAWSGWFMAGAWTGAVATLGLIGGSVLIVAGGALATVALIALDGGDALTAVPHPRDGARLVAIGPYRHVRHQIYGGLVLAGIGWSLARGSTLAFVGAVALLVFFDLKRRREEAWLAERFAGYAEYAVKTRRLIPWVY